MLKAHIPEERLYRNYAHYGLKVYEVRDGSRGRIQYVIEYRAVRFGPVRLFLDLHKVGDTIVIRTDPLPEIPESARHYATNEGHRSGGLGCLRISARQEAMEALPQMVVVQ